MSGRTGLGNLSGLPESIRSLNFRNQKRSSSPVPPETLEICTNRKWVLEMMRQGCVPDVMWKRILIEGSGPTFTGYHDYRASRPVALVKKNLVGINDLMGNVNQVMKGKFFLCRTITTSYKIVSEVEMAVEDPQGDRAVLLALYNYLEQVNGIGPIFEAVVPKGCYLVIKNPWLTSTVDTARGGVILRCDDPGNVELISEKKVKGKFPYSKWRNITRPVEHPPYFWDQMTLASYSDKERAKRLKDLGNLAWVEKRFTDAIRWYKMGLDYAEEQGDRFTILNNMTAALMGMECWNAALKCVEEALQINGKDEKALYRKGKCLIWLEKWEEAIKFLEGVLGHGESLKKMLEEAKERQKVSTNPNLLKYHWNGFVNEVPIMNYKGPVAIATIPGKGRGLVATQPLVPGQLILLSKAFSYAVKFAESPGRFVSPDKFLAQPNRCYDDIVCSIANQIALDPEMGREFYSLTAGRELGHLDQDNENNGLVDMKRINKILTLNAFQRIGSMAVEESSIGKCVGGIYVLPSFLNHSCLPNCAIKIVYNILMLEAVRNVKEGEELTIFYVEPRALYEERNKALRIGYDFACNCLLCVLDASEPKSVHDRRSTLVKKCRALVDSAPDEVLEAIEEIILLGKSKPELNMTLVNEAVDFAVEKIVRTKYRIQDCLPIVEKMISVLENNPCMNNQLYDIQHLLLSCFTHIKDKKKADDCFNKTREIFRIYDGPGVGDW